MGGETGMVLFAKSNILNVSEQIILLMNVYSNSLLW